MSANPETIKQNGKPSPALLTSNRVAAAGPAFGIRGRKLPDAPPETGIGLNITADTYEQIGCDPEASAALMLLVYFVLADGVQLSPAVSEKDPKFARAAEITEHLERTFAGLERELKATLEMLLRPAMQFGNKIAEKVYVIPTTGPDAYKLVLKSIKVKPRGSASFVVDEFMNLLGLIPTRRPAMMPGTNAVGTFLDDVDMIPPEKFVIATFRMQDEDPRGQSIYRPVVKAWNVKQLAWPEFLTYLMRCAVPGLVAILAQTAKDSIKLDSAGDPVIDPLTDKPVFIDPITEMLAALIEFKNSTALVVENGTDIKPLEVGDNDSVFDGAFAFVNKEIRKGILLQELATAEGQFQTRASTSTQMGIVDLLVRAVKTWLEDIIQSQICYPQIVYNYGEADALELTPKVMLGDFDRRDWSKDAEAVATLLNTNKLSDSQEQSILLQVGLPPREEEEKAQGQDPPQEDEEDEETDDAS